MVEKYVQQILPGFPEEYLKAEKEKQDKVRRILEQKERYRQIMAQQRCKPYLPGFTKDTGR